MKTKLKICLLCAVMCLFLSCRNNPKKELAEQVNQNFYRKLTEICPLNKKSSYIVYYMDGDCSLCLAKASAIEHSLADKKDFKAVIIARTMNKPVFLYHLNQLKISSCTYVEPNREFEKDLAFMKITQIQANRVKSDYGKHFSNN